MKWESVDLQDKFVSGMTEYGYVHVRVPKFPWEGVRKVYTVIQSELDKKAHNTVSDLLG
jgi:hypothetical protein